LYSIKLGQGGEDKICCLPSIRRRFEVRSFHQSLCTPIGPPFPWKSVWRIKPPSRVAFVNGGVKEDFNFEQLEKDTCHSGGLMLHVHEEWKDYKSPSSPS